MRNTQPKSTNRVAKMNSLIQQVMSETIREFLEGEPGLATVTKVDTSGDLKWAKVWISIVGGNDDSIFNILNKNIYDIQGELNENLDTKIFPRISFHLDTAPRYAQHIDELIKHVHEEDEQK